MAVPHDFTDTALLSLALTHASTGAAEDNERLEFLGDAALDLIVAEELYRLHADLAEGELTERKAWVVSRRSLADAARRLELEGQARVGRGLNSRTLSRSVLANLYEAVIGAIYLDAGIDAVRAFVLKTLDEELAEANHRGTDRPAASSKQLLQEFCQRTVGALPRYEVIDSRGEAHARAFLVRATLGEREFPSAWGRNRKEAEHWAAREALFLLEDTDSA